MMIKECYAAMGGDYDSILNRLHNEKTVEKFLEKFLNDESYSKLKRAFSERNREDAFRAAQMLEDVAGNLGFERLMESSCSLADKLRQNDDVLDAAAVAEFDRVAREYMFVTETINAYFDSRKCRD